MDILEMLQNDYEDLCEEDIEMIEEELAVGRFPPDYLIQCRMHINNITHYFEQKKREKVYIGDSGASSSMLKTEEEVTVVAGETETVQEMEERVKTKAELLHDRLISIRSMPDPETKFRDYIQTEKGFTNEFIDQNFSEFNDTERIILLSIRDFNEAFLDKYFDVLDHRELAVHQQYSESFFMKHFDEMPTQIVLTKSRNKWRHKKNRSGKLSTFLRLKGVRI